MEEKSEEIPSEPTTNNHSSTSPTEQYTDARSPHFKNIVHLWEFLLELLSDDHFKSLITWTRKDYREFKLKDKEEVAKRWGLLKGKKGMNYEKLSRALRYYYQYGIIKKVPGQRLVYKFDKLPYKYVPGVTRSSYQVQMIHGSIPTQKPKPCSTFARPNRFTSGSSLNNSAPPRRHSARRSSSPLKLLSHDSSVPSRRISFDHTSASPRRFSPDHTSVPLRRFSGVSRDAPLPSAMSPTESPLRKSWSWPVKVEPGQRSSWCQSNWHCEMPGALSGSRIIFPVGGPIALFPRSVAESEPESKVHPTAQSVAVPVIMWAAQTPAEKS